MKALIRINRITHIEPFRIVMLWSNGEVREIDFSSLFDRWKGENNTLLFPLFDYEVFKQVCVSDSKTLCWPSVPIDICFNNVKHTAPLDLDPDTLFAESKLVKTIGSFNIGALLQQTRKRFGLTQEKVATNCGTTRAYISRIEKGKTDIPIDTLYRIVELGMGKKLHLDIE